MKVLTDNQYYGQIADVIREQNGTNNTYTPPQMVNALKDLFYEEVEGVPPINFQGIGENLLDYRIDGASGGVGDKTSNLLQNTASSQTINGVTFTVNNDGSIICNGTSSAVTTFAISIKLNSNINYVLSGSPKNGGAETYRLDLRNISYSVYNNTVDNGDGINFTIEENGTYLVCIRIAANYTCNNLTFYPMIRLASIQDDTYEPYGYKVPVMVEGKNLAKNNYITISSSLSDLIVEKIGEFIHVSATNNTANPVPYVISKDNNFHAGTYDIVNNSDTMIAYDYKGENNNLIYNTVESNTVKSFIFPESAQRGLNIYKAISSGVHIDNYFQVMIVKHGDDTDTYEPYHEPTTTNIYLDKPIEAKANIPSEYTEVEYIESTGTQYIDTNYTPVQGDDLEFKNVTINTFNGALFSAGIESYQLILLGLGSVCYYKYFQTGNAVASSFSTITNGNIKVLNGNLYINNVLKAEADYGGAVNTTLNIFQRANNTSNLIGKIGEIIISNNGIIKRDFIPCYRKSDNVAGLYDLVNNVFYTNQGTGNFIVGSIKENESISLSDTNTNIPTIRGTNVLTVDTTVQPSNVYVKARKESQYETIMRERYEEAQAQLDALESGGE